ncbi:MAG: corrinoid protein [Deltaproteobacteria bacterium]|nr:corrinoid protein [Deltaproteobacteria bacterium]MBW2121938.1 corrinoid protein [Deltaproteobacteria bacterium]
MEQALMDQLREAVIGCDEDGAREVSERILELNLDAYQAITEVLTPAIREMGDRFERGEVFLPQLMMAGDAMNVAVGILKKAISKEDLKAAEKGTVVLGTVKGDIHNIGKNIVGIMLTTAGYEVVDLGVDVEPSKFIEGAEKAGAQIIGASALMTFTASNMKVIAEYMEMEGVRDKYKLVFGGGPLTESWAKEMGADGYARDAIKAVEVVEGLMRK